MTPETLTARARAKTGRSGAQQSRREGNIPGVFYGRQVEAQPVEVDGRDLARLLRHGVGSSTLVHLLVEGQTEPTAVLLKEIQRDPVSHLVRHVDFHAVVMDEVVHVEVPIEFVGTPRGEVAGGVTQHLRRELNVACLPLAIPASLRLEVQSLAIGDLLTAGQVELPEGVVLLVDPDEPVIAVGAPTVEVEKPAEAEEAAEGEEAEGGEDAPAASGRAARDD